MTVVMSASIVLRPLLIEELPLCVPFAQRFHQEYHMPGTLIPAVFIQNWTTFLTTLHAIIFSAWQTERLVGGLGAMIHPDLNDGRLVATEMFWFMDPDARTGMGAIRLLKQFMAWGEQHATETRLVHMLGGYDAQLARIYRKLGYRPVETAYIRPNQHVSRMPIRRLPCP